MFGRRRKGEDAVDPDDVDLDITDLDDDEEDGDDAPSATAAEESTDRTNGPWDSADLDRPQSGPADWGILDLGSMVLTLPVDAQVQMDVDEQTRAVNAVAVQYSGSVMQLMPYAGPRTSGIWPEVRGEIAANITASGGTVDERPGPMGVELRAVVPGDGGERVPARFMGIDGPRWFLRAVVTGSAAHDDAAIEPVLNILRQVVVVRDEQARPLQEPLPVRLPQDESTVSIDADDDDDDGPTTLNPFERGPEITEIH